MTIETVADAVAAFQILYKGKDPHLMTKLGWWRDHLGPDKLFASVTPDDLDEGLRVLMDTPANTFKRGQGVVHAKKQRSNGTINKYVAALGTLYKVLKLNRRLPRTFASPVVKGLMLPLPQGKTLTVSLDDVKRLIEAAHLTRNRKLPALIAVAATTGLRKSNIQSITWNDLDLKLRTIDVKTTKNGTPTRAVIPVWVAKELSRIQPENPENHMPIFDKREFKKSLATALDMAGLPDTWTFHSLRHVAASILAQSGASLVEIMSCLNHKTPGMALRYSHLNTTALEKAVTKAWG